MKTKARPMEFNVQVSMVVTSRQVADLLVGAFEGGSSYWIENIEIGQVAEGFGSANTGSDDYYPRIIRTPLSGGFLRISIVDEEESKVLSLKEIKRGLDLMASKYQRHWGDFIMEGDDATTSDVFLQLCVFGELIYG